MNDLDLILVGRGPSAYAFDWSDVACDVMAVASGIFTLPKSVKPKHFASLDEPVFFQGAVMHSGSAWFLDPQARHWPFWNRCRIQKHVASTCTGWNEYPNVWPWEVCFDAAPKFKEPLTAPIGIERMNNSVFFAVHVAFRLGYRRLGLLGIFEDERYANHRGVLDQWLVRARNRGCEWCNCCTGVAA